MSTQEKRAIVSITTTIITFVVFYMVIIQPTLTDGLTQTEHIKGWGLSFLLLLPIMIVAKIVLYIIYSIVRTIITRQQEEKFLTDEYGRLIESKATRNFHYVFMLGFFISMGALAWGMSIVIMFKILLLSLFLGSIIIDISSIYYVRKGV